MTLNALSKNTLVTFFMKALRFFAFMPLITNPYPLCLDEFTYSIFSSNCPASFESTFAFILHTRPCSRDSYKLSLYSQSHKHTPVSYLLVRLPSTLFSPARSILHYTLSHKISCILLFGTVVCQLLYLVTVSYSSKVL